MIKVGIVGTGGIAEWHASAFKDNKNSERNVISFFQQLNEKLVILCKVAY